jgi:hypothetical protein
MTTDYSKGKIYKIFPINGDDICYIGSTTKTLNQRMKGHRDHYHQWKLDGLKNTSSSVLFEKYGENGCRIELIKLFPCSSKSELHEEEERIRKLYPSSVNVMRAFITSQERAENKIEYDRKYRENNKEKRREYHEKHKQTITCECGSLLTVKSINDKNVMKNHLKTMSHGLNMMRLTTSNSTLSTKSDGT